MNSFLSNFDFLSDIDFNQFDVKIFIDLIMDWIHFVSTHSFVEEYFWWIIVFICYSIAVLLVYWFIDYSKSRYNSVIRTFVYEIDRLIYLFNKTVYQWFDQLIRRDEALPVIYYTQKKIFLQKENTYLSHYAELKKDFLYCQELFDVTFVPEWLFDQLDQTSSHLDRYLALYEFAHLLLAVLTLGLSRISKKSLLW